MDVNNMPPRTTNRIIFITLNVLLSSHINNGMMNPVMVAPIIVSIIPILNFLFMIIFALLYMLSSKLNNNPNIITANKFNISTRNDRLISCVSDNAQIFVAYKFNPKIEQNNNAIGNRKSL